MKITNYEQTGLDRVAMWLEEHTSQTIGEKTVKDILRTSNISFVAEGISRVQSMLLCECKDSYIQQSQRYVTVESEGYRLPEMLSAEDRLRAKSLIDACFQLYREMSLLHDGEFKGRPKQENYRYGIPIEDARYILPLATKTNMCITMSGDKLYDLFALLADQQYGPIFADFKRALEENIPASIINVLPQVMDTQVHQEIVQQFYQSYFDQLTPERSVVLLESFSNLDQRVGLGALTSTQQQTSSELVASWGELATEKAKRVAARVLGYGHDSIAEQARTTFGFMCSLVTYHQQIRHRLPENCRENWQALLADSERTVCVPGTIKDGDFYEEFIALAKAVKEFRYVIYQKYGQAAALSFLLNADQIKVISATNARIDIKMLADRTCMNSQWEIRNLAIDKLHALRELSETLYDRALPPCLVDRCREGKMSCGKAEQVRVMFKEGHYGEKKESVQ